MRLILGFLGVFGITLLFGSAWLFTDTWDFVGIAEVADGTVVDLRYQSSSEGGTFYPVVRFRPAGGPELEFESGLGSKPASYERGESVTVLYDPADPAQAEIDSFMALWFAPIISGFMGTVFGAIGLGYWFVSFQTWRRNRRLEKIGRRINAHVVDISRESTRHRAVWRVTAQWKDPMTGDTHTFKSDFLPADPSAYLAGDWIPVLIDPQDPQQYKVDLSQLPEQG